jgi:hypothetical protein
LRRSKILRINMIKIKMRKKKVKSRLKAAKAWFFYNWSLPDFSAFLQLLSCRF